MEAKLLWSPTLESGIKGGGAEGASHQSGENTAWVLMSERKSVTF